MRRERSGDEGVQRGAPPRLTRFARGFTLRSPNFFRSRWEPVRRLARRLLRYFEN